VSLTAGSKLGPYEIVAPLGAGGMGEVYRARDPRLGREVAIKVLPAHLSEHPEVRARFEREARTVSSLNHPHICVIHDVGRDGATDFLVMELVDGETLAQRLERGALPAAEVLRIGGQIADALDKAHRAGVVHRDLKPGNVMLTRAGAKLMDFGLARSTGLIAAGGSGSRLSVSQSPTVAAPLTAEGSIIGTFQYMSPEQLEGRETDARGDLWALGCVLYEMATGKRAFEGRSQASLIGAIMNHEPAPIAQVAPLAPPALDRLVRHLLAKDPEERIQSAHDVKLQLATMAESGSSWSAPAVAPIDAPPARRAHLLVRLMPWAIAAFAVLVVIGLLLGRANDRTAMPTRTVIAAPPATRMHLTGDDSGPAVISPDGTQLVFAAIGQGAGSRLWLRRLDELVARPLNGTDGAQFPFWSPDSRSIGFFTDAQLKCLDLDGGGVRSVARADGARGGTWSKRGVILYALSYTGGLWKVPVGGGTPVEVTRIDTLQESTHRWPQFMPDGEHFIYLSARHDDPVRTAVMMYGALSGGRSQRVVEVPNNAVYASGHLLYVRDSTLVAQGFDPGSGRLRGEPVTTSEIVKVDPTTWRAVLSASNNGLLVYGLGGRSAPYRITWFDRTGRPLGTLGEAANHISLALSPDGSRAVVETQYTPNADLWIHHLVSGVRTRITTDPFDETSPVWSPDGRRIAIGHQFGGRDSAGLRAYALETLPADGLGERVSVLAEEKDLIPYSWWPDQSALLFGRGSYRGAAVGELWRIRFADRVTEPLLPGNQLVGAASLSPDGRWIAFSSLTSGRPEIVVIAATPSGVKPDPNTRQWPLTSAGGDKPVWSRDSKRLYYMRPDGTLVELVVNATTNDFVVRSESVLFQAFQREYVHSYDVTADGRFLISVAGSDGGAPLAVVTNWTRTLRRR
jgi:Tol biopolymer transport system component